MSSPKYYQHLRKFFTEQVALHVQPQAAHCVAVATRVQCQRQTPKQAMSTITCTGRRCGAREAFGSKSGP